MTRAPLPRSPLTRSPAHAGGGLAQDLVFVAGYIVLDIVGRTLLAHWSAGLPWYPPAGLAVAYFVVRGWRAAPWLVVARELLWLAPGASAPLAQNIVNSVGAAALTVALATLFRRLPLRRDAGVATWSIGDASRFFALSLLAGAAYGTVQVALESLERIRLADGAAGFALRYGIGDAVGITVLFPLVLLFWPERSPALRGRGADWVRILVVAALTGAGVELVNIATGIRAYYLALLPLAWAAVRGGIPGAALGITALDTTLTATWALMARVDGHAQTDLVELQAFMLVASAGAMLLGSAASALEGELRQRTTAEERLRAVVDQSVAGFYTVVDGRFAFVNQYFASLVGYTVQELLAMPTVLDVIAPESQDAGRESLSALAAGTYAERRYICTLLARDGGRVIVEVHAVGVMLGGRPAIVGATIDRTALEIASRALREREEQLRQAQKMEAVGRLAGGVAHDFNNMLTAIGANVAIALQETEGDAGVPESVRDSLREIGDASARATDLTRQLLAFGRKQVLRPQALRLDAHVSRALPLLRRLVQEDVRIDTALDAGGATTVVDPVQLEQVLLNLVVNARDAVRDAAEKRVTVQTCVADVTLVGAPGRPGLPPGRYVMLSVRDTGHGMDAETQARIFEPFYTTKALGEGTGLGLATVFGAVKQSGGYIYVESTPGAGATFSVYLPEALEAVPPDAEASEVGARDPDGVAVGDPRSPSAESRPLTQTVLVVEDEDVVRRVVRRSLTMAGYRVVEASDPTEALRAWPALASEVGIVVTDMVMPEMDGLSLAAALRERRPDLRVLLMSGYSEALLAAHGPLPARTEWLSKPFTTQALRDAVAEMLR